MREMLRILGLAVLLAGAVTLLALLFAQSLETMSPALIGWEASVDVRRGIWIAAGALYVLGGLTLALLRRWAAVAFIVGAVVAAACMAYDMAAFTRLDAGSLGAGRIRLDIISLVCLLLLSALTVPLARRRVLK